MSPGRNASVVLLTAMLLVPAGVLAEEDAILDVQAWFVSYGDLWWEPTPESLARIKAPYQLPYYLLPRHGPTPMEAAALARFPGCVGRPRRARGTSVVGGSARGASRPVGR